MNQEQEKINRRWTEGSDNYDRIIHDELNSFRVAEWRKLISVQAGNLEGLEVLDCGCGPGFFTIILSEAGSRVTAIDASDGMLEKARRNLREQGGDARLLKMDCHDLTFSDNSFDLVLSRNLTHTLLDHVRVYSQWFRVLKPGGTLLIFDANWHLPLVSEDMFRESMEREKKGIEIYGSDFSGNTVFDEETAEFSPRRERGHRLGDLHRPDWDCGILKALGFREISYDRDITESLWDEKEKLIYGNTPLFMLRAKKPAQDNLGS